MGEPGDDGLDQPIALIGDRGSVDDRGEGDQTEEQERREQFAYERVDAGESTVGVFPLADERRAEYEAWLEERKRSAEPRGIS